MNLNELMTTVALVLGTDVETVRLVAGMVLSAVTSPTFLWLVRRAWQWATYKAPAPPPVPPPVGKLAASILARMDDRRHWRLDDSGDAEFFDGVLFLNDEVTTVADQDVEDDLSAHEAKLVSDKYTSHDRRLHDEAEAERKGRVLAALGEEKGGDQDNNPGPDRLDALAAELADLKERLGESAGGKMAAQTMSYNLAGPVGTCESGPPKAPDRDPFKPGVHVVFRCENGNEFVGVVDSDTGRPWVSIKAKHDGCLYGARPENIVVWRDGERRPTLPPAEKAEGTTAPAFRRGDRVVFKCEEGAELVGQVDAVHNQLVRILVGNRYYCPPRYDILPWPPGTYRPEFPKAEQSTTTVKKDAAFAFKVGQRVYYPNGVGTITGITTGPEGDCAIYYVIGRPGGMATSYNADQLRPA